MNEGEVEAKFVCDTHRFEVSVHNTSVSVEHSSGRRHSDCDRCEQAVDRGIRYSLRNHPGRYEELFGAKP